MWWPRAGDPTTHVRLAGLADLVASLPEAVVYRLSRESVYRHLRSGGTIADIHAILMAVSGEQPTPQPAQAMLASWEREYGRLRLRTVTVLESDARETLQHLFARRGARRYLAETLSPRAAVVAPGWADHLQRWLLRQGHLPRVEVPLLTESTPPDITPNEAAYLWLAVQVYRALSVHWRLPLRIPQTIVERLEGRRPARLDPGAVRPWIAAAEACDAALRHLDAPPAGAVSSSAVDQARDEEEEPAPPREGSSQRAAVVAQLEAAIQMGTAVALTYYTAGRDAVTERRVEPLRVEWWGAVPYLIAWSRRAWRRAERVFRIDRIRRLEVLTKP